MRTTADECRAIGDWIGEQAQSPARARSRFLIPEKGVSALDIEGGAFFDPEADARAVRRASRRRCSQTANRRIVRLPLHINDPAIRRGRRRGLPRNRQLRESCRCRHSRARRSSKNSAQMIADGVPIVGGGAGTGLSAKAEEAGGIDLIIIYNSGRYRMAGRGSAAGLLAYGNANEIVKEMARRGAAGGEAHAGAGRRQRHRPLRADAALPRRTEGHGLFRRAELSDHRPVRRRDAPELRGDRHGLRARGRHDRRGARARPPDHALCVQSRRGARHDQGRRRHRRRAYGRDHRRLDRRDHRPSRSTIASARSTPSPTPRARCASDVILLCHGGPISMPDDARYILERCQGLHGFYGASSMERLPAEVAIRDQTADFKALRDRRRGVCSENREEDHEPTREDLRLSEGRRRLRLRLGHGWR